MLNYIKSSVLFLFIFICSCDKKEANPAANDSRDIKYEITGNYSGTITLVCTTNNDNFEIIEVNKLPWKLEFKAKPSITTIVAQGTGSTPGVAGQTATLKTFVGTKEVGSGTGTALSSGFISVTNPVYILK